MWITHDGKVITGVYSGRLKKDGIEVPESAQVRKGDLIAAYDNRWNRRPMEELVKDRLVTPPEGMVWENGDWRQATDKELVDAGRKTVGEREKLVGETVVSKSQEELYNEGLLTDGEANAYVERTRLARLSEIDAESIKYLRKIAVGEATQADRDRLFQLEQEAEQLQIEEQR